MITAYALSDDAARARLATLSPLAGVTIERS